MLKKCGKCNQVKDPTEFGKGHHKGGLCGWCKVCMIEYNRERRQRPEYQERQRKWDIEHKQKRRSDPTYIAVKNEQIRERRRADSAFRIRQLNHQHKRRLHEQINGGNFTLEEWQALCNRYGNKCLACNKVKPLTFDHVIPVSKGGSNDISNIQPLCQSCNSRKGTRAIDYRQHITT